MNHMNPEPGATDRQWAEILRLCREEAAIGFGALDSFLSGPDLDRRIALVEREAPVNLWLRLELRDTLALDQSNDWTPAQHERLRRAAFGAGSDPA